MAAVLMQHAYEHGNTRAVTGTQVADASAEESMASTFETILVPTDFGPESEAALTQATRLARDLDASIHLLYVVSDPVLAVSTPDLYGIDWQRLRDDLLAIARRDLEQMASRYVDVPIITEAVAGPVGEIVVQRAKNVGADLIVMGTHGRGGVGHLFLGSVAERVLRRAQCPVMTVRTTAAHTEAASASAKTTAVS
jgi:nucleotide-binding universal stress UspA family protein